MLALMILLAPAAYGQTAIELLEQKTLGALRELHQKMDGALGASAIDLTNSRVFSYHGDTQFAQASSIKIPILIEMYRQAGEGKFRMTDRVTLTSQDRVDGSGHLKEQLAKGPVELTVKQIVTAMMESSDNSATNWCIRKVGMGNVNRTLDGLGFPRTRLQRVMLDGPAARRGDENISTPNEMARLAEVIHRGRAVSESASKEMIEIMKLVKAHFRKALPASVEIASKPGGVPGVKCETGIVYLKNRPFAMSVMTAFVPADSIVVEQAAAIVYRHFERIARANVHGHFAIE